jgi:site-specific recombinase XerD
LDIDIENKTLFVQQGKCGKDRLIPLNQSLIEILADYIKERKRMKKCCPYFFTCLNQDMQMGEAAIKRLVFKLREKSNIHFYPHLLRHTFATLMLEGGCNLYALSKMMGHSDIKTTTIYLGASNAHLQEQMCMHPIDF